MLTDVGGNALQYNVLNPTYDFRLQHYLARALQQTDRDRPQFPANWQPDIRRQSSFSEGTAVRPGRLGEVLVQVDEHFASMEMEFFKSQVLLMRGENSLPTQERYENVRPGQLESVLAILEAQMETRYMEVDTLKKRVERLLKGERYEGYRLEQGSGSMAEFQSTLMRNDTRSMALLFPDQEGNGSLPFHIRDIHELQTYLHRLDYIDKLPDSGELLLDHLSLRESLPNGPIHWLRIRQERQDFRKVVQAAAAEVDAFWHWYTSGADESRVLSQTYLALKERDIPRLQNRFAELLPRLEEGNPEIQSKERISISDIRRALGGEIKAPIGPYIHNGEGYVAVGDLHRPVVNLHQQGQNDLSIDLSCAAVTLAMAINAAGRGDEARYVYRTKRVADGTPGHTVHGVTEHDLLQDVLDRRLLEPESDRRPTSPQTFEGMFPDEYPAAVKPYGLRAEISLDNKSLLELVSAIAEGHSALVNVNWGLTRLYQAHEEGLPLNTLEGHERGWSNHLIYVNAFLVKAEEGADKGYISHIVAHDSDSGKTHIYPFGFFEALYYLTLYMEPTYDELGRERGDEGWHTVIRPQ